MPIARGNSESADMIALTNFCLDLTVEKKKDKGEDCETHSMNSDFAYFGVFDGCGGAGAQICHKFYGKTEAYIASRVVGEAFQNWFENAGTKSERNVKELKEYVIRCLMEYDKSVGEKNVLLGTIKKKFPTTAAAGICYPGNKTIEVDLFWAGDSRIYLLTPQGLNQLTEDDLGGIDAMENLTEDGVLTNMVNLSRDFTIHTGHLSLACPGFIFAATDGCFGYLSTPMEFEYLLLETMLTSNCVSSDGYGVSKDEARINDRVGWREKLAETIGSIAGDDYSISGYAFGFDSFEKMKKDFLMRANLLYSQFIFGLNEKSYEEKIALWQVYKDNYYRFLCQP